MDAAVRLGRHPATTDRFELDRQTRHDLELERDNLGGARVHIQPLSTA